MIFIQFFITAAKRWHLRGAEQRAAALAYFTPFALAPLIIFSITILGVILGSQHVIEMLIRWGNGIDTGVTTLLYEAVLNFEAHNMLETQYLFPLLGLLFLSLMIFVALNSFTAGLHALWDIEISGWRSMVKRLWRSAIFIVLLQLYLTTIIIANDLLSFFSAVTEWGWLFLGYYVLGLGTTVLLLSVAYGVLPLMSPSRTARLAGAAVATMLLLFSRELVAVHFATAPVESLFGAAGLLISLLVWVYVAAAIVLYGAACAYVYDEMHGRKLTM